MHFRRCCCAICPLPKRQISCTDLHPRIPTSRKVFLARKRPATLTTCFGGVSQININQNQHASAADGNATVSGFVQARQPFIFPPISSDNECVCLTLLLWIG